MLPYSPFDSDCHVVTEIFDRTLGKWCMLDPTTNGYLVDETGSVLSLLEARERMAQAGFVTFCRADETVQDLHEVAQKEMEWSAYFAKNLFRLQIDAVSQAGCDPGTLFGPTVEQGKGGVPHHDGTGVCKNREWL